MSLRLLRAAAGHRRATVPLHGGAATARETPEIADTIYRRYFLAGIAVVLSAGATWGAWLLWTIGLGGSFRAVSVHAINAHGEAQIFGWVGLVHHGVRLPGVPADLADDAGRAQAGGRCVRADGRGAVRPHGRASRRQRPGHRPHWWRWRAG